MWIVRLALRRPYTLVVLALLPVILGPVSILRTPVDIFPKIDRLTDIHVLRLYVNVPQGYSPAKLVKEPEKSPQPAGHPSGGTPA